MWGETQWEDRVKQLGWTEVAPESDDVDPSFVRQDGPIAWTITSDQNRWTIRMGTRDLVGLHDSAEAAMIYANRLIGVAS